MAKGVTKIDVKIELLSPIHLGSGQADVNIDAEIVHDEFGLPYFPGKRFKGLLYESAVEVSEMFELSGLDREKLSPPEEIFHRHSKGEVQLIVPNFFIKRTDEYEKICAEWRYLQAKYPEIFTANEVLNSFTTLRFQTRLEDGIASEGSLHNLRVLESGLKFFGEITVLNADQKVLNLLALAIKNLTSAGTKRNRGFGKMKCLATIENKSTDKLVEKIFRGGDLKNVQNENYPANLVADNPDVDKQRDSNDGNASGNKRVDNSRSVGGAIRRGKKARRRGAR